MLLGEFLEHLTVDKARKAITSLIQLSPKTAWVRRDGREAQVPIEEVKTNEVVIVKPGERIPVDGKIISGCGMVNQSTLTGESMPVERGVGDKVFCGTVNESGSCELEATQVAEDTKLAQIKRLILEAQAQKSPTQRFMDRFSRYFIPVILLIALLTFLCHRGPHPGHHHSHRGLSVRTGSGDAHGSRCSHWKCSPSGNPDQRGRLS